MSAGLSLDEALPLVRRLGFHARDEGLLASALGRPTTTVMGAAAYPSLPMQAAALLEATVRNHALIDGNKRTAWVLTVVLLGLGGYEHDLSAHEVFDLVVGVAEGRVALGECAEVLGAHLVPAQS